MPEVVKNLMIINGLLFFLSAVLGDKFFVDLSKWLALYQPGSGSFMPHQLVTHVFMHGSLSHIFFNMFALWMFGSALENVWGAKRFLVYYMLTGIGAGLFHLGVTQLQISWAEAELTAQQIATVLEQGKGALAIGKNFTDPDMAKYNYLLNIPTVGASGAVFGLLLGFGMLFPNQRIYLYFAIPIKAKYFVIGYGLLELITGLSNRPGDNVAHFAHLGGMVIGFLIIKYWQRNSGHFY